MLDGSLEAGQPDEHLPFAGGIEILTGGGLTLAHQLSGTPNGAWATFSVPSSAAGWTINPRNGSAAAFHGDADTVEHPEQHLFFAAGSTNDTQWLDNVVLATSAPEPATAV
ncbi:MAG TPA: hypothetical protein VMS37_05110 [Verrucomicrobiae bacterium]|nr:hypothetical protein [Verrucomicrobiae bacterium]